MTETLTSPSSLAAVFAAGVASAPKPATEWPALEAVPFDWGWWDCQRLATEAEMAECGGFCSECGTKMVSKVGGGTVQGTVIGYRFGPETEFVWTGVLCRSCEIAAAVADYGLAA